MNLPQSRRILRLPDVRSKTGLCTDTIYKGVREGWFPKPFKLTPDRPDETAGQIHGRASGWLEHEVDQYLEQLAAAREPTSKALTRP